MGGYYSYKYISNDERDILELAEQLDRLWELTERIEKHDVRKQLPTYLLSHAELSTCVSE